MHQKTLSELQKETREAQEKVYCKNCKFRARFSGYCTPFVRVNTAIDDYYSPEHRVRKVTQGTYNMKTQNEDNDCKYHHGR